MVLPLACHVSALLEALRNEDFETSATGRTREVRPPMRAVRRSCPPARERTKGGSAGRPQERPQRELAGNPAKERLPPCRRQRLWRFLEQAQLRGPSLWT